MKDKKTCDLVTFGINSSALQPVESLELYYKQEILHLSLSDIVMLIFIRKKCICVGRRGRQLSTSKLNSESFAALQGRSLFMQIKRNVFVQRKWVESYTRAGRNKYVHFVAEVQDKIDNILEDPIKHATGWNSKERLSLEAFKISRRYEKEVCMLLQSG